jgi:predicted nucleic-acid-binding Zn-ribbon protein
MEWSADRRIIKLTTYRSQRVIELIWDLIQRNLRNAKVIGITVSFGEEGSIKATGELIGRMVEMQVRPLITVYLVQGRYQRFFAADWNDLPRAQRLPIAVHERLMHSFDSERWRSQHPEFKELW